MNLNQIISEEINRFLVNEIFYETSDNENSKRKNHSKSADQIEKERKRDGNAMNSEDESEIRNIVNNNDLINVAALARKVFPDHTPEGAQSQLRKQLKGIKNDTGKQYHIKQRVGQEIRKQLQKL
jgi:hypothetical protein